MCRMPGSVNCVILTGPTATGKTSLGVKIASHFGWEIISADSRQVYKGLDLGSGKDLAEYFADGKKIPHRLIDIATLNDEYNVFCFQKDFYRIFGENQRAEKTTFVVGGTGMYIDSIVSGYELVDVPQNEAEKISLEKKDLAELSGMLLKLRPNLHNRSDLLIKERVIKAIQIELYKKSAEGKAKIAELSARPEINPLIIGVTLERTELYRNIEIRLKERLAQGMIDEVKKLHEEFSWERLEKLGLEYRFVSFYLEGKIATQSEMEEQLLKEIRHFAKRQETWFRGMEKKGIKIHWLPVHATQQEKFTEAITLIDSALKKI